MHIGIDFDNTIVCYDAVFRELALAGGLIPVSTPPGKQAVRDRLRSDGKEQAWRELQGEVYGALMSQAVPFDGILPFLARCREEGIDYSIISHKTCKPVTGPPYDLHASAKSWLKTHGLGCDQHDGAFFERSKEAKLERIRSRGCTHFIDDLPELLTSPDFPEGVERLLFDPAGAAPDDPRYRRFGSWAELERYFFADAGRTVADAGVAPRTWAATLLDAGGLEPPLRVEPMPGGVNNRVYRIDTANNHYIMKAYYAHPDDPRDRLGVECGFTEFANSLSLAGLHRLIVADRGLNAALFGFADGTSFVGQEITRDAVEQAMDFVIGLNRDKSGARHLPNASEACFSVIAHISTVARRVRRLRDHVSDPDALDFVINELMPAWNRVVVGARTSAGERLFEEIGEHDRCLSPSDFGFHNAIRGFDGRITFVDFEYAGWDDPAHMVCDFFCHIAVPVPRAFQPFVTARLGSIIDDVKWFEARIDILMPVYRIKWCCILLNDFLPVGGRRREFAGLAPDSRRRRAQLAQARLLLSTVGDLVAETGTGSSRA